jgi:DNA topoisomerase-1
MSKILVVVESPGKIKKIEQILSELYPDKKFIVKASYGHIIDIDKSSSGIDIENNFELKYSAYPTSKNTISDLISTYKKCDDILIATDKDREGEMIGWSIAKELGLKNPKRIVFGAITNEDIKNAIENVTTINYNMVDAQKVRRMKDRIIGYGASSTLPYKQSAGRVISVVTRIILDREKEIEEFIKSKDSSFYKVSGIMFYKKKELKINLYKVNSIKTIKDKTQAYELMKNIVKSKFKVKSIEEKQQILNAQPPFTTSTLQQEASSKLGWCVKKTMTIAQKLYEKGKITYMRTDSVNLSKDILNQVKNFILSEYGKNYLKETQYKTKGHSQEGHEAIRPIDIEQRGLPASEEATLYNLIWKKTVASQMSSAKIDIKLFNISISKLDDDYFFRSGISKVSFKGYLSVYDTLTIPDNTKDDNDNDNDNEIESSNFEKLPKEGDKLYLKNCISKEEYKKPPSRYNESLLIKKMDPKNLNIGRPLTYASTIERIQIKKYVEKKDTEGVKYETIDFTWDYETNEINKVKNSVVLGKEKNRLVPTESGKIITEYLISNFPDIMEYKYTSDMEKDLDKISDGKKKWLESMKEFYKEFKPMEEKAKKNKVNIMDRDAVSLGKDSDNNEYFKTNGINGCYLKKVLPNGKILTAMINKPFDVSTVNLKIALELFRWPKEVGKIGNKKIKFYLYARYGPYVQIGNDKISLPSDIKEEVVDVEYIKNLIELNKKTQLWQETEGDYIYTVKDGPWGRYISKKTKTKSYNVKLPPNTNLEELTLENVKKLFVPKKKNYKKNT